MTGAKELIKEYGTLGGVLFVLCATYLAGMLSMASFDEQKTQYSPNDANKDGVVDLADFSVAVDQLSRIMRELGGETMPCITQCPQGLMETAEYELPYEAEFSSVPLPYQE